MHEKKPIQNYLTSFKKLSKALPNLKKTPIPEININITKKANQNDTPSESEQKLPKDEEVSSKEELEKETKLPKKQVQLEDNSEKVLEETDEYILINDPSNEIRIKIFKTNSEYKPTIDTKSPQYTESINCWFEDPEKDFKQREQKRQELNSKRNYWNKEETTTIHAFSKLVDNYLADGAIQSTTSSRRTLGKKDILLTLPGCIYYSDSKFETGLFTYIIDSTNGQWYHRNFVSRSGQELIGEYYQKGFYEVEFPPLN